MDIKLIIAGDRRMTDYNLLASWAEVVDAGLAESSQGNYVCQVVSGGARGADQLGEMWAEEEGREFIEFPANWSKYGKAAGIMRNIEMANYADMLLAFPAADSVGTVHMVEAMRREGKPALVVPIEV